MWHRCPPVSPCPSSALDTPPPATLPRQRTTGSSFTSLLKGFRWHSPLSTAFQAPTDCLVQSQLQPTPSTCPQRPLNSNGFSSG